jgi:hypothetical protein
MAWFLGAVNRQQGALQGFAMAEQYFVKRGEKISGPFGLEQLQKLLA